MRVPLSLGTDAKVLEPEGLRIRVRAAAEAMACHYAPNMTEGVAILLLL